MPLTGAKEDDHTDKISVVGSVSDVTPPPPLPTQPPSGLNPFTPEWFTQLIGAAVSAAATAVAQSSQPPSCSPAAAATSAPRRLNERKVPDFWEDRPEFWFQIFDAHLSHFNPSERRCFDALLPLLTPAAHATVHSVIRTPGGAPYSKAREALLRHFGRTPRQLARDAREARSLGDKLPSEFLDHVKGLLPDVRTFYEVALLDALPPNARVAALQHSSVEAMARAADDVILENRAELEAVRPAVSSLTLLDNDLECDRSIPPPLQPTVAAASREGRSHTPRKDLCANHARWGKKTYKCLTPSSCKMRSVIIPRPPPPSAPGNGRAGGQ